MKTLTDAQAEALRVIRPKVRPVVAALNDLASAVAMLCRHGIEGYPDQKPKTCPACSLYERIRDAAAEMHYVPDDIDKFLLDGPHPNRKDKRKKA